MTGPAKAPDGAGRRLHIGGAAIWTGLLGLIVAVVGTVIAYEQARLGTLENQASEQQSLVSLVTNLAGIREQETSASSTTIAPLHEAGAADAAQGLALVDQLHDHDIPSIDNLELGAAFEVYGEWHDALVSFNRAASTGAADPVYRSKALRAEAAIEYYIGGPVHVRAAHADTAQAAAAFAGQPDVPALQAVQDEELAYLWDARFVAGTDCMRAAGELSQSGRLIAGDRSSEDAAVAFDFASAREDVNACMHGLPVRVTAPGVPTS